MINPKKVFLIPAENLDESIRKALEALRWKKDIKPGTKVLIKPNLCSARNIPGINTNKELLRSLVCTLRDRTENVVIGESDATSRIASKVFGELGDLGCEFVNFSRDEILLRQINGRFFSNIPIPQSAVEPGVLINVPLIKTHTTTTMTCCLKNLFGLLPERDKVRYHSRVDDVIADVNSVIKPHINIVDATYCMEGLGPQDGKIFEMNLILASRDAICCDYVVCKLMGLDPFAIRHLMLCCDGDNRYFDDLEIVGEIEAFKRAFALPKYNIVTRMTNYLHSKYPVRKIVQPPLVKRLLRKTVGKLRK